MNKMEIKKYKNPQIKVTWEDVAENFTNEKLKRVKSYFQEKYNSKNVRIITKTLSIKLKDIKLKSLDVSDNILDPLYQKNLMKDFLKENNSTVDWNMLDRLDNRVNEKINENNQNKVRYNKWFIKKIQFSNFLSFGENNVIDYSTIDGITVIESSPKNFSGKSTLSCDLLLFLFFNTTTKSKTNIEIFNKFTNVDDVKVKGEIVIDGEDYVIERNVNRKLSKSGEYNVTNKLEFFKRKADGTLENLSGEQRRETELFISSAIGTEEDFLSTILTTGYNLEQLIDSKPTARGQILTKFMGLESLKNKEEKAKELYNDWSRKLISNSFNIKQLEIDNNNFNESIINSKNEIEKLNASTNTTTNELENITNKRDKLLTSKNNDIDPKLININPVQVQNEINSLIIKQNSLTEQIKKVNVVEPKKYYSENEHELFNKEKNNSLTEQRVITDSIERDNKILKQFEEGSICPTCKRALENVDHTKEINDLKEKIITSRNLLNELIEKHLSLDEKENVFKNLKNEYELYEKNKLIKARYELEFDQKTHEINLKTTVLKNYESIKKKLEDNKEIDNNLLILKTQIETLNATIRQNISYVEKFKSSIISSNEKIKTNIDLISKIKSEEELIVIFKTYLTIYGKNGISKIILRNMIPLINEELYRLLIDSCYFILEMNINDKNEVEFIMIDTETRVVKPLSAGSGYERTISSLALRSVLTKISTLPKPNIIVMDEVFGKIADENLEMVGEFFKKIKNYFENIILISHNPLIRNWSDNLIMVKKEDNISSIDYITRKNK
jgi:hypothetical protein